MPRPRWSADGLRILFQESDGGKTYLASITVEGTDRRRLVENERAEEIVPSPDGRWVAFKELHNVYVAPLAAAGKDPVKIEASGAGVPVRQLSRYGGDWLDCRPEEVPDVGAGSGVLPPDAGRRLRQARYRAPRTRWTTAG
jgi:hypothetical protein